MIFKIIIKNFNNLRWLGPTVFIYNLQFTIYNVEHGIGIEPACNLMSPMIGLCANQWGGRLLLN